MAEVANGDALWVPARPWRQRR